MGCLSSDFNNHPFSSTVKEKPEAVCSHESDDGSSTVGMTIDVDAEYDLFEERFLLTMAGRRKRSQRTRSKRSSGSTRSKRSSSSNIATVVSFAVVNVDLDDPNQNVDQSKRRTKMLAESACLGASESTADKGVTMSKPDTVNVGVATDEFQRVEAHQPDVGDSAIQGAHEQANAEKHLGQIRKVSFTGEEHIANSNEARTPQPHETDFYEVQISRRSMADSTDTSISDPPSRVKEESPASRRKKGSKAKSQPRRRSSTRRRQNENYRSKSRRDASRGKSKSSRKSRTREQKGSSPKSIGSTSARKSSSGRREIPIIRKGEASQTPYYTPRSASDAAVPEAEYTPTMESMGVRSCNCDECLRYEERAQAQFEKRPSQRFPLTIRQTSRSKQDQQSPMRKCPYRSASNLRKGIHTTPRRESRKLTKRSTLKGATPSGSLHTDFNIALPSASQRSEQYPQSGTAPKPTADGKSLTAQSLTTKNLTTSTDYNPERDYNPVCDCTNCQIHRSIREADDLCDCYDCVNAMRATGSDNKTGRKQYKLNDPPTEGHKPKPPRQRGKTTYPWVKQLTKLQQPDKPYNSFKQKSVQKDSLEVEQQRLSSGKNQLVPEKNGTSAIIGVPRNARRSKGYSSTDSLARHQDEGPSTKRISQEPPSSHSPQVDQSSGSTYKTTESSETRSYSSTDRRGTTPSTTGNMTSTDAPTTLTSSVSTGTTYQSTPETETSVSLSDHYVNKKILTADDKRRFHKRNHSHQHY